MGNSLAQSEVDLLTSEKQTDKKLKYLTQQNNLLTNCPNSMKPSHCERETTLIEIKTILDLTEISNERQNCSI